MWREPDGRDEERAGAVEREGGDLGKTIMGAGNLLEDDDDV